MEQSDRFKKTKETIKKYLMINDKERHGYKDEHYDAITASFLYLQDKYPNKKYVESNINDAKKLSEETPIKFPTSLSGLYLARIIMNVKSIKENPDIDEKGVFDMANKLIEFNDRELNNQVKTWPQTLHIKGLKGALRQKVVLHEFYHAGSGIYDDFDKLEELLTEKLALDTLGQKKELHLTIGKDVNDRRYKVPNPESSNRNIYVFAEILTAIHGEKLIEAKLCGSNILTKEFNSKYNSGKQYDIDWEKYKHVPGVIIPDTANNNGMLATVRNMGATMKYISENSGDSNKIFETSVMFQTDLMRVYFKEKVEPKLKSSKVDPKSVGEEEICEIVNDIANIRAFLSTDGDNKGIKNIDAINKITGAVMLLCETINIDFDKIQTTTNKRRIEENNIGGTNMDLKAANPDYAGVYV